MDHDLGVGRFAGVFVAQAAAVAEHALADVIAPQAPAGDVHLVNALVAQVAVAVVPEPVPVVVQLLRVSGSIGAGPDHRL